MTGTKCFHFGILVEDLEAAKKRYAEILGVTFGETLEFDGFEHECRGRRGPGFSRLAYSVEGPPFVELNEAQDDTAIGPWGRSRGEGLHHIGAWEKDVKARLDELRTLGILPDTVGFDANGQVMFAYLPPSAAFGASIELVSHIPEFPGYTPDMPGSR